MSTISATGPVKNIRRRGSGDTQSVDILLSENVDHVNEIQVTVTLSNGMKCRGYTIALCCFIEPELSTSIDFEAITAGNPPSYNKVAQSSSFTVSITNSDESPGPYTWTIVGSGFWLDSGYTIKELKTTDTEVTIYTDAASCGWVDITVEDRCKNEGKSGGRSDGNWNVACESGTWPIYSTADMFVCCWHYGRGTWIYHSGHSDIYELIFAHGKWKQWQQTFRANQCSYIDVDSLYCDHPVDDLCFPGGDWHHCGLYEPTEIENCIDPENHPAVGSEWEHDLWCWVVPNDATRRVQCFVVYEVKLYFWDCP